MVIGSAKDIVEECGVARFVFSDFPLGNPCGKPYDAAMQRQIVGIALDLLETARFPRTTVTTPFVWSEDESWKQNYAKVDSEKLGALRQAGDRRRQQQDRAKTEGRARSS